MKESDLVDKTYVAAYEAGSVDEQIGRYRTIKEAAEALSAVYIEYARRRQRMEGYIFEEITTKDTGQKWSVVISVLSLEVGRK